MYPLILLLWSDYNRSYIEGIRVERWTRINQINTIIIDPSEYIKIVPCQNGLVLEIRLFGLNQYSQIIIPQPFSDHAFRKRFLMEPLVQVSVG